MRILDRYLIRELLMPWVFGVAMFTAILLGASVLPQVAKLVLQGGTMVEALWIFFLLLPAIVVLTFPMAMLLATLLGLGRLSADSETVATLACGISLRRMVLPVIATAVVIAVLDFAFQETLVPRCTDHAYRLMDRIRARGDVVTDRALTIVAPDPNQGPPRLFALARKLKLGPSGPRGRGGEGSLLGVTIVYLNERGEPEAVAHADEARYAPKLGEWRLLGVTSYILPKPSKGEAKDRERVALAPHRSRQYRVNFGRPPEDIGRNLQRADAMTVKELRQTIRNRTAANEPAAEYEVQLQQRFAVPAAAIVFALIGVPLGLRRQRTASSLGLGLSVLIIFIYYILWYYLGTIGEAGALHPVAAAWIPNFVGTAVGLVLLQRAPK